MKKLFAVFLILSFIILGCGCQVNISSANIAATTLPVYTFTAHLCQGTNLTVTQIISQNTSCLHDYSLQLSQVRTLEASDVVIVSGAGFDAFINDIVESKKIIDASSNIDLICDSDTNDDHDHNCDPHIWLSPETAMLMSTEICNGLCVQFPNYSHIFQANLKMLLTKLEKLHTYAQEALSDLHCNEIITFHDGFAYLANAYNITILQSIEEESGSEASAKELKELIELVRSRNLPAIFVEKNGSASAANIIAKETGVKIYSLDMVVSGNDYFGSMYQNINTLKEALG